MSPKSLRPIAPADLRRQLDRGAVLLVDVREAGEHARERIPGAVLAPLSGFGPGSVENPNGRPVVFHCKSGQRTQVHAARLLAAVPGEAYVLAGGIDGWKAAGQPVERGGAGSGAGRDKGGVAAILSLLGLKRGNPAR